MNIATAVTRPVLRQTRSVTTEKNNATPANPPFVAGQFPNQLKCHPASTRKALQPLCTFLTLLSLAVLAPLANAAPNLPQTGLIMHLEANVGVQTKGQTVTNWWDQSGYGQSLRAAGSPKLRSNVLNGKPVIEFNAAADELRQTQVSSLPTYGNDRTLIVLSAIDNATATIGYGNNKCGGKFALQNDREGYSALANGCTNSPKYATGEVAAGQWRLNVLVVESGTFYHLRDGELVDGRSSQLRTASGPFQIATKDVKRANSNVQVAAVIGYNWALDARSLRNAQRYLANRWFGSSNYFPNPPKLRNLRLPEPKLMLSNSTNTNKSLKLSWRVSFADECRADTGWTRSTATSGTQLIRNPQRGAQYGLNCWHSGGSATEQFKLEAKPVRITWQIPTGQENLTTGYRLFLGTRSKRYRQIIKIPANPGNSYTLDLAQGTYFMAMSTVGRQGRESSLSGEMRVTID